MTSLKLHKDIYLEEAVSRAIANYGDYGSFDSDVNSDESHILITVTPEANIDSTELIGEFANFVLADSIETQRCQN